MVVETGLYDLLGISPDATAAEVRRAYRRTALRVHPDRTSSKDSAKATETFQRVQQAYAVLYDAESRRIYDEFGASAIDGDGDETAASALARMRTRMNVTRVTKDDIEAFGKKYRFSDDERDDIEALFRKLNGAVARALEYIPYADRSDISRLIAVFDELLEQVDEEEVKNTYANAKSKLETKAKGVDQRKPGDHTSNEVDQDSDGDDLDAAADDDGKEEEQDDNDGEGENDECVKDNVKVDEDEKANVAADKDDVITATGRTKRKRRAAAANSVSSSNTSASKKKGKKGDDDDMNSLIAQLRQRQEQRAESFNGFVHRLESKYKDDPNENGDAELAPPASSSSRRRPSREPSHLRGVTKRSGRIAKSRTRRR